MPASRPVKVWFLVEGPVVGLLITVGSYMKLVISEAKTVRQH